MRRGKIPKNCHIPFSKLSFLCRFAQENDLIFLETSAKTGDSVEEAFLKCSKTILAKIETGELDPERIGSGIQYGESLLRRNQQAGSRRAPDCNNLPCNKF